MFRSVLVACFSLCVAVLPVAAEITAEQVSGKTLVSDGATIVVGMDGSFSGTVGKGDKIAGTWAIKKGQWCRTISTPKRHAGTSCQAASIKGKTLTLIRDDGSTVPFKIK